MENDVILQIQNRMKSLLLNDEIQYHREHESFHSHSGTTYQFLIWKHRPQDWQEFSKEIQELVEKQHYQCIPEAWDFSAYNPDTKTGYKVIALYKPVI